MISLGLLTLVAFGPSQYGKSTFIQRLGGQLDETSLRKGAGRSVTAVPNIYEFNITWPGGKEVQPLAVVDLPGLDDTELRMSNLFISAAISIFLVQRSLPQIDAFLLFNSLAESSTHIKSTFKHLSEGTGNITSSVVVILSKSDLATVNTPKLKQTAIEDCTSLGVPYVEWTDKASESQMRLQLTALHNAIQQALPFKTERIQQLENKTLERAELMQKNDPDRIYVERVLMDVKKLEEYEEIEEYTTSETVKKYDTPEKLNKAAEEMQKKGPKDYKIETTEYVKHRVSRTVQKTRQRVFLIFPWKERYSDTVYEDELIPEIKTTYVERPLDYYIPQLEKETEVREKKMTRNVKKYRELTVKEEKEIQHEHPFEYYIDLARKVLMQESWNMIRAHTNKSNK